MKPLRLFLLLVCFGSGYTVFSQDLDFGARYLFEYADPLRGEYGSWESMIDSVNQKNDSIWFAIPNKSFLKVKEKTYLLHDSGTFLLYDYNLQEGDTFELIYWNDLFMKIDTSYYKVIKLESRKYLDGIDRKVWTFHFVRRTSAGFNYNNLYEWIENFGANFIWDYTAWQGYSMTSAVFVCSSNNEAIFNNGDYVPDEMTCDEASWQMVLSSDGLNKSEIRMYPNPAKDYLYCNIKMKDTTNYTIFNSAGLEVSSGIWSDKINVSELGAGSYFLQIETPTTSFLARFFKF
jgi:hypothetical protein